MIPRFFYDQDPLIITAQVAEDEKLPTEPEFEVPQTYTVDEAIAFAGRNTQLVRIEYTKTQGPEEGINKTYVIEPYSYRMRGGKTFLFGYDVDSGQIKAFRTDSIRNVQVMEEKYSPKWIVEL